MWEMLYSSALGDRTTGLYFLLNTIYSRDVFWRIAVFDYLGLLLGLLALIKHVVSDPIVDQAVNQDGAKAKKCN